MRMSEMGSVYVDRRKCMLLTMVAHHAKWVFGVKKRQTYLLKYIFIILKINIFSLTFNPLKLTYKN